MACFDPEYRIRLSKIEERLRDPNSALNIDGLLVSLVLSVYLACLRKWKYLYDLKFDMTIIIIHLPT